MTDGEVRYWHSREKQAFQSGATAMLESIRAFLRDYPNADGDIEVMREVERIVKEAVRVAIEKERS